MIHDLDTRELLGTPEDAARRYEAALYDDDGEEPCAGWCEAFAMLFGIVAFAALCFCGGLVVAAVWSAHSDVPARGAMDGAR